MAAVDARRADPADGRPRGRVGLPEAPGRASGEPVLEVEGLASREAGVQRCQPRPSGAARSRPGRPRRRGRTELARVLFGIERRGGEVLVDGRPFHPRSPGDALAAGVALVPEDRKRQGLVMTNTVGYNLALPWTREWLRGPLVNRARRSEIVSSAIRGFAIKTAAPAAGRRALRRQPAEDRRRQMDGASAQSADPRRTDARGGRRRQGRDPSPHRRPGGARAWACC